MLSEEMKKEIEDLKEYHGLEENKFYCDQILRCVPKEFYKNQEFVKEAVKVQPLVLRFVDDELITREIVELAMEKDPLTLNLTPFKNDETLGIKAVKKNPYALEWLRELRDNFNVVKAAVEKEGFMLEYASERLQNNYEIVKTAVSCEGQGGCLRYASDELRANKEIALIAIKNSRGRAKYWITDELEKDDDIIKAIEEEKRKRTE